MTKPRPLTGLQSCTDLAIIIVIIIIKATEAYRTEVNAIGCTIHIEVLPLMLCPPVKLKV